MLIATTAPAAAGGLVIGNTSPRAVGRAGTGVVGDDGGGALVLNPAAIARREGWRAELGLAFVDDEIAWQSDTAGAPVVRNQAPSSMAPQLAGIGSIGDWIVGASVMTAAVSDRSLRRPRDIAPDEFGAAFDYRYAGIAGSVRRDLVTIGVARRLGDSVAVGVALGGSRIEITELRRMWAGFSGRDTIGAPQQDLEISFAGTDAFVPSVVAGVLVAPADTALELGASIAWSQAIHVDADVAAIGTRPLGPSISTSEPAATLDIAQPLTLRAGGRYLGEHVVVELGGELARVPLDAAATSWTVYGMRVVDRTGVDAPLAVVPSRISLRTHGAVRGAVDVELVRGFLWATAGYAFSIGSVERERQSPVFGDLGGHTTAIGLEASSGGFTFTFGWARTWAIARHAGTRLALDNPFGTGDAAVPSGVYDGSIDQIGFLLAAELDPP
ncbi:MAG TPA: hypothetical protein VFQ53_11940 [Kofleriaceae bacterium]|nr:hypothetical protein [Kofleriaceae bacterium]